MRFKIDENLPAEYADILREAGHDAQTVWDEDLQGKADPVIGDVCQEEDRILVTLDRDFSDIRAYPPSEYPGIIAISVGRQSKTQLVRVLRRTIPLFDSQPIRNRLWIVDEHRVRIRPGSE